MREGKVEKEKVELEKMHKNNTRIEGGGREGLENIENSNTILKTDEWSPNFLFIAEKK